MMTMYIDLELLKIRADVVIAAMNSNIDELYVRYKFTELVEDLRDLHIDLIYKKEQADER